MRKYLLLILVILLTSFVSASFTVGNGSSIEETYAPRENLKGWINISLQEEPANSLLSAFMTNITLLDFLKANNLVESDYSCIPTDCNSDYALSEEETSKTFSLTPEESKIIGINISGNVVDSFSSFSLSVDSNAPEASASQLIINIGDEVEWKAYSPSGSFGDKIYGCYEAGSEAPTPIGLGGYCEKITIPVSSQVQVGASIIQEVAENANLEMYIDDTDISCQITASTTGEVNCVFSGFEVQEEEDFFVCIKAKTSDDENKYKINYEQNEPCGFSGSYSNQYTYDFPIFSQTGGYAALVAFTLDNTETETYQESIGNSGFGEGYLEGVIDDYVDDRYDYNCTNGCVVPIKFTSQAAQSITISGLTLSYASKVNEGDEGIIKSISNLYETTEESAKISMSFKKLNVDKANLAVPSTYGNKTAILRLNNDNIINQAIKVAQVPIVERINPLEFPAAVPVQFIVFVSGNVTEYTWEFEDNVIKTDINQTYYTFPTTGEYDIKVSVKNNLGTSSKTFAVKAISPEEEIPRILGEKMDDLNKSKRQLDAIVGWHKEEIEKILKLDDLESEIEDLERKFGMAESSEEFVEIMQGLNDLKIPDSIQIQPSGGSYFPNPNLIDPYILKDFLEKDVENPENYKEAMIQWINNFVEITTEIKNYIVIRDGVSRVIASGLTLKIRGIEEFNKDSYLIIDESYTDLVLKENYGEKAEGDAIVIELSELGSEQQIFELIFPEELNVTQLPLYISPEFSDLPRTDIGKCDNDGKCEKDDGETFENCPNDCVTWWHKWKPRVIWLIVLLIIAFIVYIALQEWYKRYYEGSLFRNKNDVFNLICFIDNALNQKLSKSEIYRKLKGYGWTNEQVTYALKKVQGKRTGMWEIPIFRPFEKKKMKREIAKRRILHAKMPGKPFVPKPF